MKISLGMLAYNESQRIAETIRCVFAQTLFASPREHIELVELVVVPNGCTDNTAEVAERTLREELAKLPHPKVKARVEVVPEAGKSNAWNRYVHDFAVQDADMVFLLDSDVLFTPERCFDNLIDTLDATPVAHACVGRPLKDIALKKKKSLFDRLSLAGSSLGDSTHPAIAGSLYVVRGEIIRRIWMPRGLLVEDGYIRAMLITNFFTNEGYANQYERVARAEQAHQVFEAVKSPAGIFRHSRRLLVGMRINACVYDVLWHLPKGVDAGSYAKKMQDQDPEWLKKLVREKVASLGYWVMPPGFLFQRFHAMKRKSFARALRSLPMAVLAWPFEALVLWSANSAVRRGEFRW